MGSTIGDIISTLSESGRYDDIPRVWHAYEVANQAHVHQLRATGARYIIHPVAVAAIVASQGGTGAAICAALLHDVIEDTSVTSDQLHAEFGPGVASIVADLTLNVLRDQEPA